MMNKKFLARMIRLKKYDVFISVAEEDLPVAQQLAAAFKARNISYYLFSEKPDEFWGNSLIRMLFDGVGHSRYVLQLNSRYFMAKFWTRVELQIAFALKSFVLELCLEEEVFDPRNAKVIMRWRDNPDYIAERVREKLAEKVVIVPRLILLGFIVTIMGCISFFGLNVTYVVQGKPSIFSMHMAAGVKVSLPGRRFFMGSQQYNEIPPHVVFVDSFSINSAEVTVAEFQKFCNSTGHAMPLQPDHRYPDGCPVTNVTWYEAAAYCKWVGGRLPTEAEWEYAAKADTITKYSGGNNARKVAQYGATKTSRIELKCPNRFGLYDMSGNAAEWCADLYADHYSTADSINPKGPQAGTERVVRGGSYKSGIEGLRITARSKEDPNARRPDLGFRVAWDQ